MAETTGVTAAHDGYRPRRARDTVLYRVVAAELESFLASARGANRRLSASGPAASVHE